MAKSNSVQDQINRIVAEYIADEREKIAEIAKETAQDTAKLLKKTSPRSKNHGKHYADGWRVKSEAGSGLKRITALVYNATKPQLTQLLTRSHDIMNQYGGPYGRSKPDPHMEDAEEYGSKLYLERLEREL